MCSTNSSSVWTLYRLVAANLTRFGTLIALERVECTATLHVWKRCRQQEETARSMVTGNHTLQTPPTGCYNRGRGVVYRITQRPRLTICTFSRRASSSPALEPSTTASTLLRALSGRIAEPNRLGQAVAVGLRYQVREGGAISVWGLKGRREANT